MSDTKTSESAQGANANLVQRLVGRPANATREALQVSLKWLDECRKIGWHEDDLDALESLWWEYHDSEGNFKTNGQSRSTGWTRNLPTESGAYWWWNEDEDSAPIHIEIMYSATDSSYFAPAGQYGWTRFQPVSEMSGWWMRLHEPQTPNAKS